MKGRICCFVMILPMLCWVPATSRPDPHDLHHHQPGTSQSPQLAQTTLSSQKVDRSMERKAFIKEETQTVRRIKVGSSPPRCEDKCFGCSPCQAVEIPTSGGGHMRVQYANYAPEHWECKCGTTFYDP